MTDRLLRYAFLGLGAVSGSFAALYYLAEGSWPWVPAGLRVALSIILGALAGLFFVSVLFRVIGFAVLRGFSVLERASAVELLAGAVGLIAALLIGVLLTFPLPRQLPLVGPYLPSLVTAVFGYVGLVVATRKSQELSGLLPTGFNSNTSGTAGGGDERARPKVLDTSAVLDGRLFDVIKTGAIEGCLVVPSVALLELQHIADSPDPVKRALGRRGLKTLSRLKEELGRKVEVDDRDFTEVPEADGKIARLAQALDGVLVTDDYNLNQVAGLKGIPVINLNELANALKPAFLPGEEFTVQVTREGKEAGQGVGYLFDGTMVVVEDGRDHLGETVEVAVTSVLQTTAGRMIFARLHQG